MSVQMPPVTLQGSMMDRNVSAEELDTIRNAKSLDDVSSVWGKFLDLICGTKKERAIEILFHLTHPELKEEDLKPDCPSRNTEVEIADYAEKKRQDNDLKLLLEFRELVDMLPKHQQQQLLEESTKGNTDPQTGVYSEVTSLVIRRHESDPEPLKVELSHIPHKDSLFIDKNDDGTYSAIERFE